MPRYIDADKVLTDELTHALPNECGMSSGRVVIFVDDIEKIPTADVQEIRHAKFELVDNGKGVCSNCHRLDSIDNLAKYCRYCGAKLQEE